eukprot:CAMPEP_0175163916 /NCGR_PEP_ID=MMETSP0087-20121206/26065_1 /TAXON_ID=136419 /ORGANISM="Unknown Unknown, Strain D1" /LENGTH=492 /DNA_ID=CAMNT_0016452773 /DNA_START=39 /DNA_END=1517 /DNA_ORIENTATION=-
MSVEFMLLYGDALMGLKSHRRALQAYLDVLEENKLKGRLRSQQKTVKLDLTVKTKIAKCYVKLKEPAQAIKILESLPATGRSIQNHLMLAKLYSQEGKVKSAIASYQAVLAVQPLAIEASLALVDLGVEPKAVSTSYSKKEVGWLGKLMDSQSYLQQCKHKQALKIYTELTALYPRSMDMWLAKGKTQLQLCDWEVSKESFCKVLELEPTNAAGMELLGWTYRKRGRSNELAALSQNLLKFNPEAPETWTVVGLYCEATGNKEKALQYANKAVEINSRHYGAHLIRGCLCSSIGQYDEAARSYRQAQQINKLDLTALEGLVETYLAKSEFKQALLTAKQALQLMPRNPKALTLVGLVLSHSCEGREKAIKAFNKALTLDPQCTDAVMALAKIYCAEKQYTTAKELLSNYTLSNASDFMHTKLGQVYALNGETEKALVQFHKALAMNPDYAQALNAIERLENNLSDLQDVVMDDEDSKGEESFEESSMYEEHD